MKTLTLLLLFIGLTISLPSLAKTAHLDHCGTAALTDHKTAKKACKSGDFAGQTVVTCNNKGKQKDKRTCNSDNERKGVYVDNCSGVDTGFKNLKKACKAGDNFGDLLVRCVNGREKARMQCESADSDDDKVTIFQNNCGSNDTIEGRNLVKACKANAGQTLVKCRRKDNIWKPLKTMHCDGKKDRFKFKSCSPTEITTLISDYELAEERLDIVLGELENELANNQDMSKKLRKKMEVVRKKLEKMQTAMDRPRTYKCKANKSLCKKANAHTMPSGHTVKVCESYFPKSAIERASIIVHEISHHKTQTTDKGTEHDGCTDPNLSLAANNFHKQAEYYEHIIECGLYIPQ